MYNKEPHRNKRDCLSTQYWTYVPCVLGDDGLFAYKKCFMLAAKNWRQQFAAHEQPVQDVPSIIHHSILYSKSGLSAPLFPSLAGQHAVQGQFSAILPLCKNYQF
jgi:hypothetical protein